MAVDKNELFEKSPVLKAVLALALPSVMGQIVLVIYNMADTLFIGATKSDDMITAVTVCLPAFMFLSAISNLFGVGGASVISRALGVRDARRAFRASAFAIYGCLAVTAAYCLGVYLFRNRFIDALGGQRPEIHEKAVNYLIIVVVIGGASASMSTLLSHLIRAGGYSVQASFGVSMGGILNIALDPLFMFVILPKGMEVTGVAVATAISNTCSLIYYLVLICVRKGCFPIDLSETKDVFSDGVPQEVLRVGIPACLMTLCENISYAVLDKLMAAAGTAAQAGIGVAKKVNMLAHSFVRGMAQGVLPLIGYNYSSGNRRRMKSVLFVSGGISLGIAAACMTACFLFSRGLIALFIRTESLSLNFGKDFLKILCIGAPFSSFAYTVISFFQATGKGGRSLILALMRKGIIDIPLMFVLKELLPVYGIVYATPIADIICCVTALVLLLSFISGFKNQKADRVRLT